MGSSESKRHSGKKTRCIPGKGLKRRQLFRYYIKYIISISIEVHFYITDYTDRDTNLYFEMYTFLNNFLTD